MTVPEEERNLRRDLFFEDVARAYDTALNVAQKKLAEGRDPVEASREALVTCLHAVFVTFDHGTKLADDFNVFVVDEDGNELTTGALHEDFMMHLLETGRYE
jgi:hypothetical protein